MAPNEMFRRNVRMFYFYVGSLLVAGVGPIAALQMIESYSLASRIAGVCIGVLSWVPLAVLLGRIILMADEFTRRIHLVAMAFAFGGALFAISICDWLSRAEFIEPPPLMALWIAIAVLWVVALLLAKRHYERDP